MDAILFDFDGVVVQSEGVYDQATKKLGAHYGVEVPESFSNANRGIAEAVFYSRFKSAFELDADTEELQENGKRLLWESFMTSVYFTDGFEQFFTKIRRKGLKCALVTATVKPLLKAIFENSDLAVEFDHIVTASDVSRNKPAPDPYLRACELLSIDPGRSLVIEDSPPGLRSAKEAGCQTVAITTSCPKETLNEANFVVDSFGELEELLTIE
ncbi:MAG: HAD family phosphatase [Candidatus Marinimicrobia bacterium]|nr:HAD family phosphatase [Candidatus Neomarinimicrobiota bacterium]MCF7904005.1 HAD family phosphatase [Candidatus Neomarinimicrobiota bacterium]